MPVTLSAGEQLRSEQGYGRLVLQSCSKQEEEEVEGGGAGPPAGIAWETALEVTRRSWALSRGLHLAALLGEKERGRTWLGGPLLSPAVILRFLPRWRRTGAQGLHSLSGPKAKQTSVDGIHPIKC